MSGRILVVEDEPAIRDAISFVLRRDGFDVAEADDGDVALELAESEAFDLIVLDVMLPGLSGTEICRRLRASESAADVPIIMLTARTDELDRVLGLETGADDYISKPFSLPELQARIRALLRRRSLDRTSPRVQRIGGLELDLERHEARLDGRTVALTPSEARLLGALAETPDRPVARDELIRVIWASDYVGDRRACDTHVANLRRKLERTPERPERLVTVRGVGYALRTL
ncbi:MAG TPA: response regulator transcription factor [Gaiellaceae bacterium]